MAKQQVAQKYVFKINTKRLKAAKWNLTLSLQEARLNEEIVSLGDSQVLRWIDELNNFTGGEEEVARIRKEIKYYKKQPNSAKNRNEIKRLYAELDKVQFKPDYMQLVIDKNKDLLRACKGFKINGIKYVRLVGTNGGVKCSTIVFVSERLAPELKRRLDNGRNESVGIVPAKLESYRALACSGTAPVSMPRGIIVVDDCETHFKDNIIYLHDEDGGEPIMDFIDDYDMALDESDGYGLIMPSLAERWSMELRLDYVFGCCNTRASFEKGCVFTFDYVDFAEKVAGSYKIKDAWGTERDVRDAEIILTTSMLKLWNSYDSMEHYIKCFEENHYTFGIPKVSPRNLDNVRDLNYQFIQSYNLSDEDVEELISPTIKEIHDILHMDYRKALLFLCGGGLTEHNVLTMEPAIRSIMADKNMFNDPYIRRRIKRMISKRINDAKIGVISVHGNFSIVGGDPYILCQHMFGLEETGILKRGEIYNKYWQDDGAEYVACYRAPMSCHNNVLKMKVVHNESADYWYRYIKTCTLFNAWDSSAAALNGMDKDGDLVFLTDNRVLVDNIRDTRTILCIQRSASKIIPSEDDLIKSNIAGFGDDIGKTTNYITSMYDIQSLYDESSDEYKVLDYRIQSGQHYQQCCIDKAKGIISNPMPKYWYDRHANKLPENCTQDDIDTYEFNVRICADKKPYFMRYIYPTLMHQYKTYISNANTNCMRKYLMTIDELLRIEEHDLTDDQKEFIYYYKLKMPVSNNNCVMNRICRRIEREFDGLKLFDDSCEFDHSVLMYTGVYDKNKFAAVKRLYDSHNSKLRDFMNDNPVVNRKSSEDRSNYVSSMLLYFKIEGYRICGNSVELNDMIVDMCYTKDSSKQFVWDVVGEMAFNSVLIKNGNILSFPTRDDVNGDIEYRGHKYRMVDMEVAYEPDYTK